MRQNAFVEENPKKSYGGDEDSKMPRLPKLSNTSKSVARVLESDFDAVPVGIQTVLGLKQCFPLFGIDRWFEKDI